MISYRVIAFVSIHSMQGNDSNLKRTVASSIVALLLLAMVTASATTAGTAADPLITLSYLDGTFAASLKAEISQALGDAAGKSMNSLEALYREYLEYDFAPSFARISLATGDCVILSAGSSFILQSGSAALTDMDGTVINISTGKTVSSGGRLTLRQRYFCAENTTAAITANSASAGIVDGYYFIETAVPNRPHPVFRDIRERDWYYPAVDYVYNNNLFGGTAPNTFSPDVPMTRGMFVTVLYRLEKEPAAGIGGQFADVRDTSLYYYDAVTWASGNNIVLGYNDSAFGPNDPVTREQMATIIYRYAQYKQRDMSAPGAAFDAFPDRGDVSGYAAAAMRWAVSHGIINGSDGRLLPRNTATRAQVAQIITNYATTVGAG